MAATYAEFIIGYPEFSEIEQTLVQFHMDEAIVRNAGAKGTDELVTKAIYKLTAHELCLSPYGKQLQLVSDDGHTTYGDDYFLRLLPIITLRGQISGGGLG